MLPFDKNLKIYLFKEKGYVSFSIRVSDNCTNSYDLSVSDFEKIIEKWDKGGVEFDATSGWWCVCYKKSKPTETQPSVGYVRISVSVNTQNFHYRVGYWDMENIKKEYYHQKSNRMPWDK